MRYRFRSLLQKQQSIEPNYAPANNVDTMTSGRHLLG
jgi:hypothetical protein